MDQSGKWEVVGKPKKSKPAVGDSKQKSTHDGNKAPVKTNPLLLAGKFGTNVPTAPSNGKKPDTGAPKRVIPQKPNVKEKPKELTNLDEAMSTITLPFLKSVYEKTQASFPDQPTIWLKDLVYVVKEKLEKVPEPDPAYEQHPADFPKALLAFDVETFLEKVLYGCPVDVARSFFFYCLNAMLDDMKKGGVSTYGYRIFIQMLCDILIENNCIELSKFVDLLKSNQAHPQRCLAIMWVAGQLGYGSLSMGLTVWLEVMLPCLNKSAFSSFVMKYLEDLLLGDKIDLKQAYGIVTMRHFFVIFDVLFADESKLGEAQRIKMLAVYPKIKTLAFNGTPETTLRNFFPSFLTRCVVGTTSRGRKELLACMEQCLIADKQTWINWQQIYASHLDQSLVLLKHVRSSKGLRQKVDATLFKDTLRAFDAENEKLLHRAGTTPGKALTESDTLCKDMLTESSRTRRVPSFSLLLLLVAVVGVGAVVFALSRVDANSHPLLISTDKWLTETGVKPAVAKATTQVATTAKTAGQWLTANVPVYYKRTVDNLGPYVENFFAKLYAVAVYLTEVSRPLRQQLLVYLKLAFDWVDAQLPTLYQAVSVAASHIYTWLYTATMALTQAWQSFVAWLTANVLVGQWSPDNLYRVTIDVLTSARQSFSQFLHWLYKTAGQHW